MKVPLDELKVYTLAGIGSIPADTLLRLLN